LHFSDEDDRGDRTVTIATDQKLPGPDHPITIERSNARVVVRRGGVVIAETERALELQEASYAAVWYIPIEDVAASHLAPSDHHTYCPYKGEASYYDIVGGDGPPLANSVWYYGEPYPPVAEIRGHVAFYADRVSITVTA
jgi:uncharacterized protein (DUF427 family)